MNFWESHFWYSKSQRNGIFLLIVILFFVQITLYFIDLSEYDSLKSDEFEVIQAKIDSIKNIKSQSSERKIYHFNPNFISDFKAYQLGLSVEEIDRFFSFRNRGKFANNLEEFQSASGVSDSLLSHIAPYFKFPKWSKQKAITHKKNQEKPIPVKIRDINTATAEELMGVNIIGLKMAKRIIAYRKLLQGFSLNEQLFEVYYLKKETALSLMKYFRVLEMPQLKKININTASFKELLQLPYLDYNLTKKICQYRDENLFFENLQELKKIDSFPIEKFDRIALYLLSE